MPLKVPSSRREKPTSAANLRQPALVVSRKQNTLASRRRAIGELMVRYNTLTPKERRDVKGGNTSSFNVDRKVIDKLFAVLGPRFQERNGGYTRITRLPQNRTGDQGSQCYLEYLPA